MPLTDAQKSRIARKERDIRMMEATIARNDTPPGHQDYLRKRIAKAQKYIASRRAIE